ncbi:MAG: C2 family cysteine protease [Lapillicoccus sp.]
MAIFSKGADPEALHQSATRLGAYARECEAVRAAAGQAVGLLHGQWGGGDLDQLIGRWPSTEHQLTACSTHLTTLAEVLHRNARMQQTTSANGLGGTGGLDPTGGGGGGGGLGDHPVNPSGDADTGGYEPLPGPVPTDDGQFDPRTIHQGQIGDCWLLAALGVIGANDPQFIRDHMSYDATTNTYTVTLYDDGQPVQVTVDASTVQRGEKGDSSQANWASIYEKAVASYSGGSYGDIDGGWPDDAMELITGRNTEHHDDMSLDDIRNGIADGKVYAVGSENGDTWNPFDDEIDDNRVVPNHAYMVDKVELHDGQQMIHLINPWGPDGGMAHDDPNFKWGDLWLTQEEYNKSFADTYGMQGKDS